MATITKDDLIRETAKRDDIYIMDARKTIDHFIDAIQDAARRGDEIKIRGLGTFFVSRQLNEEGRKDVRGNPYPTDMTFYMFKVSPKIKQAYDEGEFEDE